MSVFWLGSASVVCALGGMDCGVGSRSVCRVSDCLMGGFGLGFGSRLNTTEAVFDGETM